MTQYHVARVAEGYDRGEIVAAALTREELDAELAELKAELVADYPKVTIELEDWEEEDGHFTA